jgi:hypothetical protein
MNALNDYLDIQQNLVGFWQAMDRADYDALLAQLTDDVRWKRDRWREGKADVLQSLEQRASLLVSRHCMTNLRIAPNGNGYDCSYGLIIFGHNRTLETEQAPYVTAGPRMGDWSSKIVKRNSAWLTREISATLIFERGARSS